MSVYYGQLELPNSTLTLGKEQFIWNIATTTCICYTIKGLWWHEISTENMWLKELNSLIYGKHSSFYKVWVLKRDSHKCYFMWCFAIPLWLSALLTSFSEQIVYFIFFSILFNDRQHNLMWTTLWIRVCEYTELNRHIFDTLSLLFKMHSAFLCLWERKMLGNRPKVGKPH